MDELTPHPNGDIPPPKLPQEAPDRARRIGAAARSLLRFAASRNSESVPEGTDPLAQIDGARESAELSNTSESLSAKLSIPQERDRASVATVDRFWRGYPQNIVDGLGEHASVQTILTVLNIGNSLVDIEDQRGTDFSSPFYKAGIASLLASRIPQFVALKGEDAGTELEAIARDRSAGALQYYIDFRLRYRDGLPSRPYTPEGTVRQEFPDGPFLREDTSNTWIPESQMGKIERAPQWGDLGAMVNATDQWGREYGFTMREGNDGRMSLNFVRAADKQVKNRHRLEPEGNLVFFHSHPRAASADGLYAPLVSEADVVGSDGFDEGGAYLNIVCGTGVTLQVDAQPAVPEDPKGWVVESGKLKGEVISSPGNSSEAGPMLEKLRELGGAFAYSINIDAFDPPRKVMFVHIPWKDLDTSSTTLQEVCFGDGLQKIIAKAGVDLNDTPRNLHEAIQKTKKSQVKLTALPL